MLAIGGCAASLWRRRLQPRHGLDQNVKAQQSEVDNQFQRRIDLVQQAVATVKGTAAQEQKVFLGIAEARKAYFQPDKTLAQKAEAADAMVPAISRLLLLQEQYPELKSNEAFLKLQDQIEGNENRLAVARKNYNEAVNELNLFTRTFPNKFFAQFAGVHEAEFIKAPEAAKTGRKSTSRNSRWSSADGCSASSNLPKTPSSAVREITVAEVRTKLDRGEPLTIIDVRERDEWDAGHVPGAVHLSKGVIERDIEKAVPDPHAELVLYCGGGSRSALAADNLQKMGYDRVWSLIGGMKGWRDDGQQVEGAS